MTDVTAIVGYRHAAVEAHLATCYADRPPATIFNPFWAVASSIGSVWAAYPLLEGPFCLVNGDTLFEPRLIAEVIAAAPPGIGLAIERLVQLQDDDMRVVAEDDLVVAVGKQLCPTRARFRSLGLITCRDGAAYRSALSRVIDRPEGVHGFHHDVIGEAAASHAVRPIVVRDRRWQEIDTVEDIARVEGQRRMAA